jgi:lysophospholipase L1-like esterase
MADQPEEEIPKELESTNTGRRRSIGGLFASSAVSKGVWWLVGLIGAVPLLVVFGAFGAIMIVGGAVMEASGSADCLNPPNSSVGAAGSSGGNTNGQLVQASQYGGPGDPSSGYTGAYGSLVGKSAFAELSTHPENPTSAGWDFSALGGLEPHALLRVTNPTTRVTLVMEKLDVGRGGASRPKIDLWYEAADVLGFHGIGKVIVAPAQPGDVPSLTPISNTSNGSNISSPLNDEPRVYLLGDSIGLGAKAALESDFQAAKIPAIINASESRSILRAGVTADNRTSGVEALNQDSDLIKQKKINTFVIQLGTNGEGSPSAFRTSLQGLIARVRSINPQIKPQIYVVNIFSPGMTQKDAYNIMLERFADEANFTVIDADSKKIETGSDQIHPTPTGQKDLAELISSTIETGDTAGVSLSLDCSTDVEATGSVQEKIVQTALKYSLPEHHSPPYFVMDGDYSKAVEEAIKRGEWVGGASHPGIDCGGFVTRVIRDSGVDPNYNAYQSTVIPQQKYMDDHPELYKRLDSYTSLDDLKAEAQPGDIAINSVHTYIYVGDQPNFDGNSASASFSSSGLGWRTPMASDAYLYSNYTTPFVWYRYIGQVGGKPTK